MSRPAPLRRTALTLGLAAGGVAVGHAVAYVAVAPDAAHRASLLAETGHALWHAVAWVAVVAAAGAALAHLARQFGRGRRHQPADHERGLGLRLAVVQSVAFVAMEVIERLDAGVSLRAVLERNLLLVGLAVQVLVAFLLASVLRRAGRAASTVGRLLSPGRVAPTRSRRPPPIPLLVVAGRLAVALLPSRAPPIPS